MKTAVVIAINDYLGAPLSGPLNDAKNWLDLIDAQWGDAAVSTLLDRGATARAVSHTLGKIIRASKRGDVIRVFFSGHGVQVADRNGDEEDYKDEAWCLYDGLLVDDNLGKLLANVPAGVDMGIISDSCHSATVIRGGFPTGKRGRRARLELALDPLKRPLKRLQRLGFWGRETGGGCVLLAGCAANSNSYEYYTSGRGVFGALSLAAYRFLRDAPEANWNDLYKAVTRRLNRQRFEQEPELSGPPELLSNPIFPR